MSKITKRIILIALIVSVLLIGLAGFAPNLGVSNMDSLHLSDFNGTATPNLLVNQRGSGVIMELQDAGTAVFQVPNGGGIVLSTGFDLNGQALTWDADGDTQSVTSFDDTITTTLGVATGRFNILTGNFAVGNGTPDVTLNGEDAYVEGTLEVDGLATLDGGTDYNGAAVTLDADADTIRTITFDDTITYTLGAATGSLDIVLGNLQVGNGIPTFTQDGEDAYIEGDMELGGDRYMTPQTTFVVVMSLPITPTGYYQPMTTSQPAVHNLVSPVAAPTDDTIGKLLLLHNIDSTDVITIDGTGTTVECKADIVLGVQDTLTLLWNGDDWICTSTFDNS